VGASNVFFTYASLDLTGRFLFAPAGAFFSKAKSQPQERKGRAIVDIDDHLDKPPQSKCSVLLVASVISEQSNNGIYEKHLLRSALPAVETVS
jgi:hypothetical protein